MNYFSRRTFLQKLGVGVGTTAIASTLPSFMNDAKTNSTNNNGKKLNIALCGLGRYAGYLAEGLEIAQN